jgi:hypothetical protein
VEHQAALLVEVAVEEVDGLVVNVGHDGPSVAVPVLLEVGLRLLEEGVAELVDAQVVLLEEQVEVGGEALVQPGVGPVATGQEVAVPLVGQLVGDQRVGREVQVGASSCRAWWVTVVARRSPCRRR